MAADNEGLFYRARTVAARFLEPQRERDKIRGAIGELARAYEMGPWQLPPADLARQLKEQDPWMLQDILNQVNWEALGTYTSDSNAERQRIINDSIRLFKYSPLAQFSLWLWTGWGLGDEITVIIRDNDKAQAIWDEFWTADRNQPVIGEDVIHDLSNFLLRDGNTFLAFFTDVSGRSTIRELPTEEITGIVAHPDDRLSALFYQRSGKDKQMQMFYPDWLPYLYGDLEEDYTDPDDGEIKNIADAVLPKDAVRMEQQREATDVTVLHIAHNRKERGSLWGWPLLTCPSAYMKSHKMFSESRLTVAQAVAMFVRRKQVSGGSRAVRSVAGQMASALTRDQLYDTNPPPYAGSVEVENEAVRTTDLPLRTGALDAKADNELFAWIALLGAGLFPTSAGLDTTRWATALEMDKAQSMLFETYKTFWSAQFTKMVRIVIKMYEKHAGKEVGEFTVQVSTDTLSLNDVPGIATSVGNLMSNALVPLIEPGIMPVAAAKQIVASLWHIILQAIGVTNADDITSAKAFEFDGQQPPKPQEYVDEQATTSAYVGQYVDGVDISRGNGTGVDTLAYAAIVREMVEDAISSNS